MRKKLPILGGCAIVLALGLFLLWHGRGRAFADVVPTPLGPLTSWEAELTAQGREPGSTFPLDLQQVEQVMDLFSGQTLRRRYSDLDGVADAYQSSMDYFARIYLTDYAAPRTRCELLLVGDYLVVNQIGADQCGTYTLSGGQEFQEELVRLLLEFSAQADRA